MSKIFFIASEPSMHPKIKCYEEYHKIIALKDTTRFGRKFNIEYYPHVTTDLLIDILKRDSSFLHYCGHGNIDGEFMIYGEEDKIVPFRSNQLAHLLKQNNRMECIVLCGCNSSVISEELKLYSNYVIAFEGKVKTVSMHWFVENFYKAYFNTNSVYVAYSDIFEKMKARVMHNEKIVLKTKKNYFMEQVLQKKLSVAQAKALAIEQGIEIDRILLEGLGLLHKNALGEYNADFQKIIQSHPTPGEMIWFSNSRDLLALEVAEKIFSFKEEKVIERFAKELKLLFLAVETGLLKFPDKDLVKTNAKLAVKGSKYKAQELISALEGLENAKFGVEKSKDFTFIMNEVLGIFKSVINANCA